MMTFDNFPDIYLFGFWGHDVTLYSLLFILLVIFVVTVVNRLVFRVLHRFCRKKRIQRRFERFVRIGMRLFAYAISLAVIFEILDISYLSVLQYTIYENERFSIQVYNVVVVALAIYGIHSMVYFFEFLINRRITRKRLDRGRGRSFFQILKYIIWVIGLIIVIGTLGVKVTLIIASISALLVGVGFGLQHIFNDLFSGIIILFDGSIEEDDIVEVEGTVGRVLKIGLRVSKLLTRDNVVIIIPNSRFTSENVINWSHNEEVTRFSVDVGVAYGSDVRLVEALLLKCAENHSKVVDKPKPFVRFNDFGESSLDFQLFFWTADDFGVENIKSDLRFHIDDQFRKNNVEIPFPQRDLHLKSKNIDG